MTGDVMPHTGMNYEGRRGATHHTCKVSDQVPATDLVNGVVSHSIWAAAATRTRESSPAGTLPGTKPQCVVNGFINHGYKGKSTQAAPPRTQKKHGGTISAVADTSAAGRVCSAGPQGGTSTASLDAVALPCNVERTAPLCSLSAKAKNPRRKKKIRPKKKKAEVVWCPPPLPPQEEEDWENEIQEVKLPEWGNVCVDSPYGIQDVLHFSLRALTLEQSLDLPVTASYSPAVHHQPPVRWSCCYASTEPDQFTDADE